MRGLRLAFLALAACAGLSACAAKPQAASGDPGRKSTARPSPSSTASPAAPTVRRTAYAHPTLFPNPTASPSRPPANPKFRQAPLQITMGSLCVLPGETQTVTIRSTPRYNKAFAVLWPDQEAHTEWGAWDYQATIGPDGTYTKAFLVPPTAPKGPARTDVSVSGISNNIGYQNQGHAFWEIATSC